MVEVASCSGLATVHRCRCCFGWSDETCLMAAVALRAVAIVVAFVDDVAAEPLHCRELNR